MSVRLSVRVYAMSLANRRTASTNFGRIGVIRLGSVLHDIGKLHLIWLTTQKVI